MLSSFPGLFEAPLYQKDGIQYLECGCCCDACSGKDVYFSCRSTFAMLPQRVLTEIIVHQPQVPSSETYSAYFLRRRPESYSKFPHIRLLPHRRRSPGFHLTMGTQSSVGKSRRGRSTRGVDRTSRRCIKLAIRP